MLDGKPEGGSFEHFAGVKWRIRGLVLPPTSRLLRAMWSAAACQTGQGPRCRYYVGTADSVPLLMTFAFLLVKSRWMNDARKI